MQFKACFSGASVGSGNDGWWRRMNRRDVNASTRVSMFSNAWSRVRRMSAGEKRLNTSSEDSGSSQNWSRVSKRPGSEWTVTDRGPVGVVGGYATLLGQPEYALLEDNLGVAGAHVCSGVRLSGLQDDAGRCRYVSVGASYSCQAACIATPRPITCGPPRGTTAARYRLRKSAHFSSGMK